MESRVFFFVLSFNHFKMFLLFIFYGYSLFKFSVSSCISFFCVFLLFLFFNNTHLLSHNFCQSEFSSGLAKWFWSRVSNEVEVKMLEL